MEKRNFTRVSFEENIKLIYKNKTINGGIENLSLKGLRFVTNEKIPLDEIVKLTVSLSGSSSELTLNFDGIVKRVDKYGLGIEFYKIDLDSFIHLRSIVEYNEGDPEKIMSEFFHFIERIQSK